MSLYNYLFGSNPAETWINRILTKEGVPEFPRYRDAWIEYPNEHEDEKLLKITPNRIQFVVLTRTGGGNRDEYGDENEQISSHPLCISDDDSDFDTTYAEFRFKIPEKYKRESLLIYLALKEAGKEGGKLSEKFKQKIEAIRNMKFDNEK